MAKIMGGGRAETMDLFDPAGAKAVSHGGTFNGNPMVMTAGLASMQHLKVSTVAHINGLEDRLRTDIQDVAAEQGTAGHETEVSGGVSLRLAAIAQLSGLQQASAAWKNNLFLACLNHGLVPSPAFRLHVSTVMSAMDIDKALGLFQAALVDGKSLIAGGLSAPTAVVGKPTPAVRMQAGSWMGLEGACRDPP